MMRALTLALPCIVLFSCISPELKNKKNILYHQEDSVKLRYASIFSIVEGKGYKVLTVKNPWQGAKNVEFQYFLRKDSGLNIPAEYVNVPVIDIPLDNIICLSSTHLAFLETISEISSITGISGKKFISNATIRQKIKEGDIKDIGFSQKLNYEQIVALKPDIVFSYAVDSKYTGHITKLKELGIETVMIAEYLENDPRAKAEWIKFFACFFDKEEMASTYFNLIINDYNKTRAMTDTLRSQPCVMTGLPWNGSWFVAGGESYAARLIHHAGAKYLWSDNQSHEAFPVDIELMLDKSAGCDYWINCGSAKTKEDILSTDKRLSHITPFLDNNIYNNNKKMTPGGGNDYWEKGVIEPHLILKDLICIFHPEILKDHALVYYNKID